jgi:hypothetical protein
MMNGIINNLTSFYQMQAKVLGVLVANTQKALEQSEKERKANEQIQRVEKFVKDLNNMLTKFYWFKERRKRQHKEMTEGQVNALVDFAHFVKSLKRKTGFILEYFQKSPTFAEKVDRDIKELEAHIKAQLKKFDEVLEETHDSLTTHLSKYVSKIVSSILRFFQGKYFGITKRTNIEPLKELTQGIREDSSAQTDNCSDDSLEGVLCGLNINATQKNEKLNHQVYSKV